jgi:hypothetical protein
MRATPALRGRGQRRQPPDLRVLIDESVLGRRSHL